MSGADAGVGMAIIVFLANETEVRTMYIDIDIDIDIYCVAAGGRPSSDAISIPIKTIVIQHTILSNKDAL